MFASKSLAILAATMAVLTTAVPTAAPAENAAHAAPAAAPVMPDFVPAPMVIAANTTAAQIAALAGLGTTVLACEDQKFKGKCWAPWVDSTACRNVPNDLDNRFTSIKNTNTKGYLCNWYEDWNCRGKVYANQNDEKLQDGNGYFNDRISSIACWVLAGGVPQPF